MTAPYPTPNTSHRYTGDVERMNSEAIPMHQLILALKDPKMVPEFRRIDRCLLCRRQRVNEAALCESCWALLGDDEIRQAERWLNGGQP